MFTFVANFLSGNQFTWFLVLIPFSGYLVIYTLNRFTDIKEDWVNQPLRLKFSKKIRMMTFFSAFVLYFISLMVSFERNLATFSVALLPVAIAVIYSYFRLKRVFFLKNIVVAIGLGSSILIVPAYFDTFNLFSLFLCLFFFIAFLINTIIFDVKDIRGDSLYGISTIPVRYGIFGTRTICCGLLIPAFLLSLQLIMLNPECLILIPFLLYIAIYVVFVQDAQNSPWWYYGLVVDGEILIPLVCIPLIYLI